MTDLTIEDAVLLASQKRFQGKLVCGDCSVAYHNVASEGCTPSICWESHKKFTCLARNKER